MVSDVDFINIWTAAHICYQQVSEGNSLPLACMISQLAFCCCCFFPLIRLSGFIACVHHLFACWLACCWWCWWWLVVCVVMAVYAGGVEYGVWWWWCHVVVVEVVCVCVCVHACVFVCGCVILVHRHDISSLQVLFTVTNMFCLNGATSSFTITQQLTKLYMTPLGSGHSCEYTMCGQIPMMWKRWSCQSTSTPNETTVCYITKQVPQMTQDMWQKIQVPPMTENTLQNIQVLPVIQGKPCCQTRTTSDIRVMSVNKYLQCNSLHQEWTSTSRETRSCQRTSTFNETEHVCQWKVPLARRVCWFCEQVSPSGIKRVPHCEADCYVNEPVYIQTEYNLSVKCTFSETEWTGQYLTLINSHQFALFGAFSEPGDKCPGN